MKLTFMVEKDSNSSQQNSQSGNQSGSQSGLSSGNSGNQQGSQQSSTVDPYSVQINPSHEQRGDNQSYEKKSS